MGAETVAQVIFGPDDAEPILGVVALENTGIGVDPVTRTLKRCKEIAYTLVSQGGLARQRFSGRKARSRDSTQDHKWRGYLFTAPKKMTAKSLKRL